MLLVSEGLVCGASFSGAFGSGGSPSGANAPFGQSVPLAGRAGRDELNRSLPARLSRRARRIRPFATEIVLADMAGLVSGYVPVSQDKLAALAEAHLFLRKV